MSVATPAQQQRVSPRSVARLSATPGRRKLQNPKDMRRGQGTDLESVDEAATRRAQEAASAAAAPGYRVLSAVTPSRARGLNGQGAPPKAPPADPQVAHSTGRLIHNEVLMWHSIFIPVPCIAVNAPTPLLLYSVVFAVVSFNHWKHWSMWSRLHQADLLCGVGNLCMALFYGKVRDLWLLAAAACLLSTYAMPDDHAKRLALHILFRFMYCLWLVLLFTPWHAEGLATAHRAST